MKQHFVELILGDMKMEKNLYKMSSYNYICNNADGDMLIYNTLKGTFCKILAPEVNKYSYIFEQDCFESDDERLVKMGVILPNEVNEETLYNALQHKMVTENKELHIVIVLTTKCNFRCVYCFEEEYESCAKDLDENCSKAILNFVRTRIHKYTGLRVSWFGGEPLLNMKYIRELSYKLIEICECSKKQYWASIVTNGYLLKKKVLEELLNLRVFSYQITIDGLADTHDSLRPLKGGQKTFDVIINNLISMMNVKGHFNVSIRTNCNSDVIQSLEEYVRYMDELLYKDDRFKLYFSPVYDAGGSFSENIRNSLIEYDEIELNLKGFNFLVHKSVYDSAWILGRLLPTLLCGATVIGNYVFTEKGLVCKCSTHYQHNEKCIIGQVKDSRVIIDDNKEAMWLYNLSNCDKRCENCILRPICYTNFCPYHLLNDGERPFCLKENNKLNKINDMLFIIDSLGYFKIL